jgi:DNA segregation ATPase FtsK/SpoIIIE-like protein
VIVIDELQDFLKQGGEEIVIKLASEIRSKGAALVAATQLPEVKVIDSIARTNFRVKAAGRLDNEAEYRAALGGKWHGTRIPDTPHYWGVGYIDLDGRGARRFRGWNVSDGWLAAHTRQCASVAV